MKTIFHFDHAWQRALLLGAALTCLAGGRASGDLRVAFVAPNDPAARSVARDLSRALGAGIDVRFLPAGNAAAPDTAAAFWTNLRAFRPQVAILSFEASSQPSDYRGMVVGLRSVPTGPQIIVCTRPNAAGAEAVRTFQADPASKDVQFADLGSGPRTPAASLAAMVRNATQRPEDATILHGNSRTLEEIDAGYASMPPLQYTPPSDRFQFLPRTARVLRRGGTLKVVMLGDSIVNDTSRSAWDLLVERDYPKLRILKITSVRGSTGCWWYQEPGRVDMFVLDHHPDLVIIGGISQRGVGPIRDVIRQIRSRSQADIFLMTGPFGGVDPHREDSWQTDRAKPYNSELRDLAAECHAQFLDLQAAWGKYVAGSAKETSWFMRDRVHANSQGEQILARIIERYFAPEATL